VVTEAIVLAGGLGTRLRSAVSDVPKPMAPVAGQPFLMYLLRFLEMNGIHHVLLAVGYRHEAIREVFGSHLGSLKLTYSVEVEPLGTGGALRQALERVQGSFVFVLNGDTFLRLNYQRMASVLQLYPGARLVVALRRIGDASRYGTAVVAHGRIESFAARGTPGGALINAGSYLVARDIFDHYPAPSKFSWEDDFLQPYASQIRPIAFECDEPFIDIGIPEALKQAQTLIPKWTNAAT
jgi:D-glycero-alpha-D-manno-heptose 1-phosphate guanylyltransferase